MGRSPIGEVLINLADGVANTALQLHTGTVKKEIISYA